MIIQIAGTNGAGKSTVVRKVMAAGAQRPVERGGKVQGYDVTLPGVGPILHVPGRYDDTPTGGCDVFNDVFAIHDVVRAAFHSYTHVLWEGGTSHGGLNQTRGPQLVSELGTLYIVLLLTNSYADCINGVNARRAAAGQPPILDDRHILANYTRARNYAARMRDAGAKVVRSPRETAHERVLELLRS